MTRLFSWLKARERAVKLTQKYYRCQAKAENGNPDFIDKHNDWRTDAQKDTPIYTKLNADVKKDIEAKQQKYITERKLANGL